MTAPIKLTRITIDAAPYEIWNAFVEILLLAPFGDLDSVQRVGHFALWYDSEVNNGGHLQYFENKGTTHIDDVIAALNRIGARCQSQVLARAVAQHLAKPRERIETVEEFVEVALQGEYDELDRAFYACRPDIPDLLNRYLGEHESSFVERVEGA